MPKPFKNWKKAIEKMKAHSKSETHVQFCEEVVAAARALQEGTVAQQLQQIGEQERIKSSLAIKTLICWSHYLACHHIPHTTNLNELVDLVVNCGAEDLKRFLDRGAKNATYTSKVAIVEFVEAIGLWAEECLLR